jgi:hypothetical protein
VSSPQVKNCICSDNIFQWCRLWKSSDNLYEMVEGKSSGGISGREGERDWDSGLKEWETEHKRGSEMAWVGNYHWGGHMRI